MTLDFGLKDGQYFLVQICHPAHLRIIRILLRFRLLQYLGLHKVNRMEFLIKFFKMLDRKVGGAAGELECDEVGFVFIR